MADKQPWIIQWSLRLGLLRDAEGELGDVLEEHAGGRSVFWLWRQVLSLALRRKTRPVHRERRAEMFSSLRNDVRYGVRSLGHNVGFTAAAVMTIALGIGINTGIFSILNGALLRSLPVPDAGKLISVHQDFQGVRQRNVNGARSMFSTSEYRSYRDRNQTLTGLMAYSMGGPSSMVTLGGDQPQELRGILVTCNYFDVLQVKPAKGVGFNGNNCDVPEEQPIVVLSHDLWMNAFGADPGIIGKSVTLNRIRFAVVGVAPEGFHGTELLKFQFFVPLSLQRTLTPNRDFYNDENASWLTLVGRRKDGVAIEQVRADLSVISNQIDQQQPGRTTTLILQHATSFPLPVARSQIFDIAAVVLSAFGLVLLVACANVANLLLARGAARSKEIAVRLALGATRGRLIQQLLTESLLIAIAGGLLGSAIAVWSFRALLTILLSSLPAQLPAVAIDASPDLTVMLFAVAITFVTGMLFGLMPAVQTSKSDLHSRLKQNSAGGGRHRTGWLRGALIGVQVAICVVLLISAGLLVRGLYAVQTVDPGFEYNGVMVVSFGLGGSGYDEQTAAAFHRQLMEQARVLPGVESVAQAARTPLSPGRTGMMFRLPGEEDLNEVEFNVVSPEYFSLVEIPIVRGRNFSQGDSQEIWRTVIVTEATARRYWPGQDPIGQRINLALRNQRMPLEIVGVARDAQITRVAETASSYMYLPAGPRSTNSLLMRGRMDFASTAAAIRGAARDVDPGVVVRVNRLEENIEFWQTLSRLVTSLSAFLGLLALLLASIGVYGVVSYVVGRRLREVGIRMALGATSAKVQSMIVRQAMRPVLIGMTIGIIGAAAVSRLLENVLFGISAFDPIAFIVAPLFLLSVATVATLVPARKALRLDPMDTLRYE